MALKDQIDQDALAAEWGLALGRQRVLIDLILQRHFFIPIE